MPLPVLLVLVVGGISAIALLLHLSGKSELCVLSSDRARAEWLRLYPESRVFSVTLAHDTHAALLETDTGAGLVWSFGADAVARPLNDFQIGSADDHLTFDLHDFTAPQIRVHLDPDERAAWETRLRTEEARA